MTKREEFIDYLKIFASLAVVVLHVASQNWYTIDVTSMEWQIFHIFDSLVRWSVPVFVMMSGALFLGRQYTLKKLYKKNILRLITAFTFWSFIYLIVFGGHSENNLINITSGYYHMWFIPMMIGLYICVPVLQKIAESEYVTKYFLTAAFLLTFLFPQIGELILDFGNQKCIEIYSVIRQCIGKLDISLFLGYSGYFIGGYYLYKTELSKTSRAVIYILGILGVCITIGMESYLAISTQNADGTYYGYFNVNVLMESVAVYVWFKYNVQGTLKWNTVIKKISECSFGVYLVHVLILELLEKYVGISTMSSHPLLSVPLISFLVFGVSLLVSFVINKLPWLNKYIV